MRVLLKIGGAQLEHPESRAQLCRAIAAGRAAGHEFIIVHGGGNQIIQLSRRLGIADNYQSGLRVTDEATAEVVLMVLAGAVNRTFTASLQRAGVPAVGICGADGNTFFASRHEQDGVDLGYVGTVAGTSAALVQTLLGDGYTPVIATVAPGADGQEGPFYNLNADMAAGPLCRAFGCAALLFLTDVPGVIGEDGRVLPAVTPADCDRLVRTGVASGGMLPKLQAALLALQSHAAHTVRIAPATGDDCVLAAMQPGTGTELVLEHRTPTEPDDTDNPDAITGEPTDDHAPEPPTREHGAENDDSHD
ncbi:MAG: acetylglutamate kinase [bacterium]|nr:acetylglutamate kinase [bacterium]